MNFPKIFVYGSLRKGFHNYQRYLAGKVKKIEPGYVQGTLYFLKNKGYPALCYGHNQIIGEILTLNLPLTKILPDLDKLEGFISKNHPLNEYNREERLVFNMETHQTESLLVYVFNESNPNCDLKSMIPIHDGDFSKFINEKSFTA